MCMELLSSPSLEPGVCQVDGTSVLGHQTCRYPSESTSVFLRVLVGSINLLRLLVFSLLVYMVRASALSVRHMPLEIPKIGGTQNMIICKHQSLRRSHLSNWELPSCRQFGHAI